MCGIAGYIGKESLSPERIKKTLHLMKNRGPDDQSHSSFRDGDLNITLLHSRLSIIDLDPRSNQPFQRGDCTVVFNGEIYNYVELKKQLREKGVPFSTESDTEVLVEAYRQFGNECVKQFEGMWAFALYDKTTHQLLLSRDRFGEKPLYVFETNEGFYFGSEIKFIRELSGVRLQVNHQHLLRYLVNGYKALYKTEETFFEGIHQVPYGTNYVIDNTLRARSERYFTPSSKVVPMTLDEAVSGFRERFFESLKLRLRSDVPLAFCLSGGVDSASLISAAVKQFGYNAATFSIIDKDERYNERDNIQATIDDTGCKSTLIELSTDHFFEQLKDLIVYHDGPLSTISYYVHAFLSKAIAKEGYRVVLSGTGADELVTGYYDHFNLHLYEMKNHKNYAEYLSAWKKHIAPMVRNPYLQDPDLYRKNIGMRDHIYLNNEVFASYLKVPFQEKFTEEYFCKSLLRNRMLNELFHEVVPPILHEDDLNSMQHSIENRSPYLDSRLFEFSYSIPPEHLIRDGYAKYVLREAMKGILNDTVRLDRRKKGFNASIHSLVDFDNPAQREYILDKDSPIFDLVDRVKIERLLSEKPLSNSFSKFLFNFINAKIFLDLYG